MDALSHLLSLYPVLTALDTRCRSAGAWRAKYAARAQGTAPYHLIVEGGVTLEMAGHPPMQLLAGDMLVLTRGQAHTLSTGLDTGEPRMADVLCGQFHFDEAAASKVVYALPEMLLIRTADEKHFLGLQALMNLLRDESGAAEPGSNAVISHLASALFTLILRAWMTQDQVVPGVFALLADPRLSPALQLMLSAPERAWTLPQLAQLCNMSRATFLRSFRRVAGGTPGALLLHIRMAQAAQWLKQAHRGVADIGAAVGYQSEAAFTKAFKRYAGAGPGQYRRGTGTEEEETAP